MEGIRELRNARFRELTGLDSMAKSHQKFAHVLIPVIVLCAAVPEDAMNNDSDDEEREHPDKRFSSE